MNSAEIWIIYYKRYATFHICRQEDKKEKEMQPHFGAASSVLSATKSTDSSIYTRLCSLEGAILWGPQNDYLCELTAEVSLRAVKLIQYTHRSGLQKNLNCISFEKKNWLQQKFQMKVNASIM